jgi:hypothetical protein
MTLNPHWAARSLRVVAVALAAAGGGCRADGSSPAPQNPSPMVDHTRAHGRMQPSRPDGFRATIDVLPRPVDFFIPRAALRADSLGLIIYFHGAAYVPETAVGDSAPGYALAVVNLGAGSGAYSRPFSHPGTFDGLVIAAERAADTATGRRIHFRALVLTAFSAGYGAVREILRDSADFRRVSSVLLLDGLHADYVPARTPLAAGGVLDTLPLAPFLHFAAAAVRGEKRMVITHSEIFPGTFASTTETTDYLIARLGLQRTPVLAWGPGGMQQLSRVAAGRLRILGFAGNSAPDHVDHLHGLPAFLAVLLRL